jgi:2-dehydro-3-deoxygluconokinase
VLNIKKENESQIDLVSLGEVLLRFDPGEMRIFNAREFRVWDGGAEYNVAANLSRVFGLRASIVTALADNSLGRLAESFVREAGVDSSNVVWREHDGIGANTRNGLYFIERGFGLRAPNSAFDRGNTAVSQLRPGDVDWGAFFGKGARWFHTGGVFTGLSETTPDVAAEAMAAARASGAIVSYDLNYRNSLWAKRGGREAANELNRRLLSQADVVFGAFEFDSNLDRFSEASFREAAAKMKSDFPNLKMIVSTLRATSSASRHSLGGVCLADENIYSSGGHKDIEVLDRVGSGDAFASAFIYAMLEGRGAQFAIDCASACGSLAMTTPGDVSMATLAEVLSLMEGRGAGAVR